MSYSSRTKTSREILNNYNWYVWIEHWRKNAIWAINWWHTINWFCIKLLKLRETITGYPYRLQLIRLNQELDEKSYVRDKVMTHDKLLSHHVNVRPHVAKLVKIYLETLKWKATPHLVYSSDIVPSDYYLFQSMAHGLFERHFHYYEDNKKWIDSWIACLKRRVVFTTWNWNTSRKIEKIGSNWWKIISMTCFLQFF